MQNKMIRNKILTCLGMMLCSFAIFFAPATTIVSFAADGTDIEVCADFKEWVYKLENGKMYKALFNNTTGQFETDWIYVCDWPPEE